MKFNSYDGYYDERLPAQVPWWWRTGPFWSSWFNLGGAFPAGLTWIINFLMILPGGLALSINVHFLWWIPTIMLIAWLVANLVVFIITLNRSTTDSVEADRLAIDQYHELPRKIKRSLRKLASQMDNECDYTRQKDFGKVVRGYHEQLVTPIVKVNKQKVDDELAIHLSTIKATRDVVQKVDDELAKLRKEALAELNKQFPIYE